MTKIRTFDQAAKDLDELEALLGTEATPQVEYGMWTNGLDFFFLVKTGRPVRRRVRAARRLAAPGRGRHGSVAALRRAEAGMLNTAFRRCHNFIHGNEGLPKDAAFWQFLYLLFAKMHDERVSLRTRGRRSSITTPRAVRRGRAKGDPPADHWPVRRGKGADPLFYRAGRAHALGPGACLHGGRARPV